MSRFYQGKFLPRNPQKYKGDPTNIWYRSSWELKAMMRFDKDPNIIQWMSEEIVIPYVSPIDGRVHRYFPDFWIKNSQGDTILIEVKPLSQTKEPKIPKRKTKRFLNEVIEWGKNQAKWQYAQEYAKDRGWKFVIITEKQLFENGKPPC